MVRRAQNNLSAGMIVAGHDARDGGSVYALPLGGTLVKVPFSIGERPVRLGCLRPPLCLAACLQHVAEPARHSRTAA